MNLDFGGALLFLIILAGLVGWGVIEFVIWLFSFIEITIK